jgi:hypothetical protein
MFPLQRTGTYLVYFELCFNLFSVACGLISTTDDNFVSLPNWCHLTFSCSLSMLMKYTVYKLPNWSNNLNMYNIFCFRCWKEYSVFLAAVAFHAHEIYFDFFVNCSQGSYIYIYYYIGRSYKGATCSNILIVCVATITQRLLKCRNFIKNTIFKIKICFR